MRDIDTLLVQTDEWAFCHIPKNGGANFKREFRIKRNIPIVKHDISIAILYHQIPSWLEKNASVKNKQWICISRNPYSRYVSWYFFLRKRQSIPDTSFAKFVKNNTLNDLKTNSTWEPVFPQSHWITPNMKVFSLENDLLEMEEYTKTKFAFKRYNTTKHKPYQEYYTQELANIVYDRYKVDFDTLNYSKEI